MPSSTRGSPRYGGVDDLNAQLGVVLGGGCRNRCVPQGAGRLFDLGTNSASRRRSRTGCGSPRSPSTRSKPTATGSTRASRSSVAWCACRGALRPRPLARRTHRVSPRRARETLAAAANTTSTRSAPVLPEPSLRPPVPSPPARRTPTPGRSSVRTWPLRARVSPAPSSAGVPPAPALGLQCWARCACL